MIRSFLFVSLLSLSAVYMVEASYPVSQHGCQCTSGCGLGVYLFYSCYVGPECTDATKSATGPAGKASDKCDLNFFTRVSDWFKDTAKVTNLQKMSHWSQESIQRIPVDDIAENAKSWTSNMLASLSSVQWDRVPIRDIHDWTAEKVHQVPLDKIRGWTADQYTKVVGVVSKDGKLDKLRDFSKEQIARFDATWINRHVKQLPASAFAGLSAAQVRNWTKETLNSIDSEEWREFNFAAIKEWSKSTIQAIPVDGMTQLGKDSLAKIPFDKMADFSVAQIQSIRWDRISAFSKEQWNRIPVDTLVALSWEQLQQVDCDAFGSWTQEQWNKMPVDKLVKLTGEQLARIPADKVAHFSSEYWKKVPILQVTEFTVNLLNATGVVSNLDATKIGALSAKMWNAVPVREITHFTIKQVQAINYTALAGWSKDTWDKFPMEKIVQFTGSQIRAIPAETVGSWSQSVWQSIPVDSLVMFTGRQINNTFVLAQLGVEQLGALNPHSFDPLLLPPDTRGVLKARTEARTEDQVEKFVAAVRAWEKARDDTAQATFALEMVQSTAGARAVDLSLAQARLTKMQQAETQAFNTKQRMETSTATQTGAGSTGHDSGSGGLAAAVVFMLLALVATLLTLYYFKVYMPRKERRYMKSASLLGNSEMVSSSAHRKLAY